MLGMPAGDSVDSGLEAEPAERSSSYLLVQAKDRLELTVTTAALRAVERLRASFNLDPVNNNLGSPYAPLSVSNNLGPGTIAVLTTKAEVSGENRSRKSHYCFQSLQKLNFHFVWFDSRF